MLSVHRLYVSFVPRLLLFGAVLAWNELVSFTLPNNCSKSDFLNVDSMKCLPCYNNQSLIPSDDRLSCSCHATSRKIEILGSPIQCIPCKQNEYTAIDQSACVPRICVKKAGGKSSCAVCGRNQVTLTHNLDGSILQRVQCISCAAGTSPSEDKSRCEPCRLRTEKSADRKCSCDITKYTIFGDVCVPNDFLKGKTEYLVRYGNGGYTASHYFKENLPLLDYLCHLHDMKACQGLANLCILSLHDNSDNSPCQIWHQNKHQQDLPWLLYGEEEAYSVLHKNKIPTRYEFVPESEQNELSLVVNTFELDGSLRSIGESNKTWLTPCSVNFKDFNMRVFQFGRNFRHKCSMGALQLMENLETIFIEPFLKYFDPSDDAMPKLYAIPVLIRSKFTDDNSDSDVSNWQLVRRFFLIDKVSGIDTDPTISQTQSKYNIQRFVRYAQHIEVKISVRSRSRSDFGRIYPPLIIVHYEELSSRQIADDEDVEVAVSVNYQFEAGGFVRGMEFKHTERNETGFSGNMWFLFAFLIKDGTEGVTDKITISIGVFAAIGIMLSLLQTWSYSKRSGIVGIDSRGLMNLFVYLCANLADALFLVAFGASFHSFVIYKFQYHLYVLPPSEKEEELVKAFVIAAFVLKIVEVVAVNIRQINSDIFFLDWERPRTRKDVQDTDDHEDATVSIWRTYFVANEFNELQTIRKICVPLHTLLCIFFFEVLLMSKWADITDESKSGSEVISPETYRFALGATIFILVYAVQYVIATIYERFFKNPIQDFVDLCTLANISVFLMDTDLHGYYIHGRSVDGDADTGFHGLISRLQREEADLCAPRGLAPANNHQTFIIRCTKYFRMFYAKLNLPIAASNPKWPRRNPNYTMASRSEANLSVVSGAQMLNGSKTDIVTNIAGDHIGILPSLEESVRAYHVLNKFLSAFFDHALEDLDYTVKERKLIERLLDAEISVDSAETRTILLYDAEQTHHAFTRTLWYGQEWTLITNDLFTFCFIQMVSGNMIAAALAVATLWRILSYLRQIGGKKNLSRKTLIDDRLLI